MYIGAFWIGLATGLVVETLLMLVLAFVQSSNKKREGK